MGAARFFWVVALVTWGCTASAQTAEETGYAIAKRAEELADGYQDYAADGKMILRTGGGDEAVREFHFKARKNGAESQNLIVFSWPGDIRGTGLLTISATGQNDDQWIYLPAARRIKRISSSSRTGSFVGSEFAYEDMADHALDDYSYTWLRDESCCRVVQAVPKFSSGYEKQIIWFDSGSGLPVQIELDLKHGSAKKLLTLSGYSNYGGVWRPSLMSMKNSATGRSTDLSWVNYQFNTGMAASEFTTRALERGS